MSRILGVAILVMGIGSGTAMADMNVSLYQQLRGAQDSETKAVLKLFIEGTYTALLTTSLRYDSDGYPMAFCPPGSEYLAVDDLYGLIDKEIVTAKGTRPQPYTGTEPIALILLNGLQAVYPCESYKRKP